MTTPWDPEYFYILTIFHHITEMNFQCFFLIYGEIKVWLTIFKLSNIKILIKAMLTNEPHSAASLKIY
jgi:hypothetical protein